MKLRRPVFTPLVTFLLLAVVGIGVSTWLVRREQRRWHATAGSRVTEITETQKVFLASRTAGSDLLFKISFASLGALLGLRFSDKTSLLIGSHSHFAAASFLLCSIYSAFLFQESVALALEGPLHVIYGRGLQYPVLFQFWFLFAAVALLAVSLFRPARPAAAVTLLLIAFVAVPAGAEEQASQLSACGQKWGESRSVEFDAAMASDMALLAERLARRKELDLATLSDSDRCAFVATLADNVRFAVISNGAPSDKAGTGAAMKTQLRQAVQSTESPTFSPGEFLEGLLALAQIWREPAGVLDIDGGARTLFVMVVDKKRPKTATWKGYTRFLVRVPPGKYQLSAAEDGVLVSRQTITVEDGERKLISLPEKR